ncbi:MAG: glycosyltransferase family 9 protein [Bacteroidota bacterium]
MKHVLVIRFSAMGDVILASQISSFVVDSHEDIHLYVVTKTPFQALFQDHERITLLDIDLKGQHKGIWGLRKWVSHIQQTYQIDLIIDLHHVLRSQIISFFFGLKGIPSYRLFKDRKGRKRLTRKKDKQLLPLTSITKEMASVWERAGIKVPLQAIPQDTSLVRKGFIGIAPTASTPTKTYPLEKMKEVVRLLRSHRLQIVLFGGGKQDQAWAKELMIDDGVQSTIEGYSLQEQKNIMRGMELLLSMDSSNMHLARSLGVPVLSIWGATHPSSGYGPYDQEDEDMIVAIPPSELLCRPCSIFGKKACYRDRMYCLEDIEPKVIVKKVIDQIQ